ncbi:UDP-N-acetylmuramate dehydrogenase [Oceaniserpentilla sp. 4NH20-0058]|uniref:UDP-N-acetylmuramate dehydrogenase n=1 Tax=Oceaniserpentilla sp. 4NH20-0058 TaxID=3127660 RepID=UPI003107359B
MNLEHNVSLKSLNTLAVDSTALVMVKVNALEQVQEVLDYAKAHQTRVQVIGGGSNIVLPDCVKSIVLQYTGRDSRIISEDSDRILVRVEAGFNWHDWVMYSIGQNWYGLENLAYIPGHVGAAPVQNIGAYGVEVKDFIEAVHGIYLDTGKAFTFSNDECCFAYRESIFKQAHDNNTLITHVDFKLLKSQNVNVNYAPLNTMASERGMPDPEQLAQWVIEVRKSKLPDPQVLPNAGSFFKNPVLSLKAFEVLLKKFPNIPRYEQQDGIKIPAGWLIDQLGLKGQQFGPVSVHDLQALVLINHDGSAEDILNAAREIKTLVKSEYGIELEQEPRLIS